MNEAERFWSKVDKRGPDECWNWTGAIDGKGYGAFYSIEIGKQFIASRYSYQITNGEIPAGLIICHKCDNPKCVNPSHLFAGTWGDNMRDKANKHRCNAPRGEKQGSARLKDTDIISIREMRNAGKTLTAIAQKFNISFQHVSDIIHRKRWGWL